MKNELVKVLVCFVFAFIFVVCKVYAISAYPYKVKVLTCNGKYVEIYLKGDEHLKFAKTHDGFTLISYSDEWWYAEMSEDGYAKKSTYKLVAMEDESDDLKSFKKECPKDIIPCPFMSANTRRSTDETRKAQTNASPIVGERRALVILMQFKDLPFKKKREDFEELFNEVGYSGNDALGSVRDYYQFASQGQLDYISDIYGPYTSKNPMSYYGKNNPNNGSDSNPVELCIEAVSSLPSDIDYNQYDNDGDGIVDNVHIIYAGYGEEAGGSSNTIWAHEYPHRIGLKSDIGFSLAGYSCSPELRGNRGNHITNIGVICHELGHALGALDYYDTNYGTGGEYVGTGKWDIMANGSWNDEGRVPANFNPYVRSMVFGWNPISVLEANQNYSIPSMGTEAQEISTVYMIETGSENDYFLLENRQQIEFDEAIPGAGLMIYHVHPNIDRNNTTNTVNATHPQGLYPVCASYSEPAKKKYGNINSEECPFPGSKNVRTFSSESFPAAVAWNGSAATVSLSNITIHSSDKSVNFTTGRDSTNPPDKPDVPDKPDIPTELNLIHKESFETSIAGRISIISKGKEKWRTYKKGNFVINAELIPEATDGANLIMLFSGKDKSMSESEAISSDIEVEPGANYIMSFDVYSENIAPSLPPLFNLYVEDEYGEYNIFNQDVASNKWLSVEIPLVFAGESFHYKLYGRIYSGGIFVDNIRLYKEGTLVSINQIKPSNRYSTPCNSGIYDIYGRKISTHIRGLNIVRKCDGTVKKIFVK